jgi:hypothetical protein
MIETVQARVEGKSGGAASQNGDVAVSSDTLSKLQSGLQASKANAMALKERFEEKVKNASKVCICKGCQKTFKSESGVKRHWKGKKNECSSDNGFNIVADVKVTPQDRLTDRDLKLQKALTACKEAQLKVNPDYNSRHSTTDKMDADRLMRYPVGNFERALKQADDEELEKFIAKRFDRNTAPKKILAQNELKARLKKRG